MPSETSERPEFLTEEHLDFLYELRASGKCNMFESPVHLRTSFPELSKSDSYKVFSWWSENFDQERAESASSMYSSMESEDDLDLDEDEDEDEEWDEDEEEEDL
jgi:hypothetical protein